MFWMEEFEVEDEVMSEFDEVESRCMLPRLEELPSEAESWW